MDVVALVGDQVDEKKTYCHPADVLQLHNIRSSHIRSNYPLHLKRWFDNHDNLGSNGKEMKAILLIIRLNPIGQANPKFISRQMRFTCKRNDI